MIYLYLFFYLSLAVTCGKNTYTLFFFFLRLIYLVNKKFKILIEGKKLVAPGAFNAKIIPEDLRMSAKVFSLAFLYLFFFFIINHYIHL